MEESESSAYERVETYTEVGAARGNRYHVPYFPQRQCLLRFVGVVVTW
jgi:hypothetical protein